MNYPVNFIVSDLETGGYKHQDNPLTEIAFMAYNIKLEKISSYNTLIKPYNRKVKEYKKTGSQEWFPLENLVNEKVGPNDRIQIREVEKELIITEDALNATNLSISKLQNEGIDHALAFRESRNFLKAHKQKYKKSILIGHNYAEFDIPHLEQFFKDHNDDIWKYVDRFVYDTLAINRIKFGVGGGESEVPNFQLGQMCEEYGIEVFDSHSAMNDTEVNAHLAIKMIQDMRNVERSGESLGDKTKTVRTFQI